ncbi:hypothetical protein SAMN04489868_10457 [Pisciglobus halotolerans]|uniref:Uncharacterized protein n=1 Tax=Pisciglobus halotolerans TaxID=745365 RepID=A0A1I3B774_9LACT|nr:hypothetical protein SAMN04489868_10457 [Pisciglobus halotolerans]
MQIISLDKMLTAEGRRVIIQKVLLYADSCSSVVLTVVARAFHTHLRCCL